MSRNKYAIGTVIGAALLGLAKKKLGSKSREPFQDVIVTYKFKVYWGFDYDTNFIHEPEFTWGHYDTMFHPVYEFSPFVKDISEDYKEDDENNDALHDKWKNDWINSWKDEPIEDAINSMEQYYDEPYEFEELSDFDNIEELAEHLMGSQVAILDGDYVNDLTTYVTLTITLNMPTFVPLDDKEEIVEDILDIFEQSLYSEDMFWENVSDENNIQPPLETVVYDPMENIRRESTSETIRKR